MISSSPTALITHAQCQTKRQRMSSWLSIIDRQWLKFVKSVRFDSESSHWQDARARATAEGNMRPEDLILQNNVQPSIQVERRQ